MNPRPDVPETIQAPEGWEIVLAVHARGVQIYTCQPGVDGQPAWTLKAPEAELFDRNGELVGHHYAGPTWKHIDGSEVTAAIRQRGPSPDPLAIPWLLLSVTGHKGAGILSRVTSIQRINTRGGLPPVGGCNASSGSKEVRISYEADYYFYAPI